MTNEFYLKRTLTNLFRAAVTTIRAVWEQFEAEEDPAEKRAILAKLYSAALRELHPFCNELSRRTDVGYPLAAEIFCDCLWGERGEYVPLDSRESGWEWEEPHAFDKDKESGEPDARLFYGVPREVRSVVLTVIALWPYTMSCSGEPIRGRRVAHMARVLDQTADRYPRLYLEWFEDMGEGIPLPPVDQTDAPVEGHWILEPQPTRVLRGILFSARFERDGVMDRFWKMAAVSERFPERVFTDPGDHKNRRCLLAPVGFGQLAQFCMRAPVEAVQRFMNAYRNAVMRTKRITYGCAMLPGGSILEVAVSDAEPGDALALFSDCYARPELVCERDLQRVDLEVTDAKRHWLLKTAVLGHVIDPERYKLVRDILFPDEEK